MPPPDISGGVRADWSTLLAPPQPALAELRPYSENVYSDEPGLVQLHRTWRKGPKLLAIAVYVSMDSMQVREKLIAIVSSTMRPTIPFVRGPKDLGELSIRHLVGHNDTLMWVFHNVLIKLENEGSEFDIVPAAYAIQAFMNRALTPALASVAPHVDGLHVSPSPIHVGNEVRLSVTLSPGTAPDINTRIRESSVELLGITGRDALSATFLAKRPGRTSLNVTLIDRRTMLSPPLSVPVEVLP